MPILNVPPANGAAPATIARAPWSVRRTSTIDTSWPQGRDKAMHMTGHARDLLTRTVEVAPAILAEDRFVAEVSPQREIITVTTEPPRSTGALAGARAGSQLRTAIANTLEDELTRGTPLYLLLDDIAGASLVAQWGVFQWFREPTMPAVLQTQGDERFTRMEGVCIGFSPDSPVMSGGPEDRTNYHVRVEPLDATADPHAWHALAVQQGPAARRARRIDLWFDGDLIMVDAHFQDSAPLPEGGRLAVHEYLLQATIDRASMTVQSIVADPRILPFRYCPAATLSVDRLVGVPVATLRKTVLDMFARTQGCTHLNDMMRSLAEVPQLSASLAEAIAAG